MSHELPALPYAYDALEPHIDAETMRLHHDIHHAGYVKGLNSAEVKLAHAREEKDFSLVKHYERELAFHGAGHFLHSIFWEVMGPDAGGQPDDETLRTAIEDDFGSFENFAAQFKAAGGAVEGSGWVLLCLNLQTQELEILTAEKHQNLSQWVSVPVLCCDVWEHAYYLKYQNKRAAYIEAFFEVINWDKVAQKYTELRG